MLALCDGNQVDFDNGVLSAQLLNLNLNLNLNRCPSRIRFLEIIDPNRLEQLKMPAQADVIGGHLNNCGIISSGLAQNDANLFKNIHELNAR
jgi:hypothetical protein